MKFFRHTYIYHKILTTTTKPTYIAGHKASGCWDLSTQNFFYEFLPFLDNPFAKSLHKGHDIKQESEEVGGPYI